MGLDLDRFFEREQIEYFGVLSFDDVRSTYPELLSRDGIEGRSVILYLIPYYGGETVNISRYAAARDYHLYIRELNERLRSYILAEYPTATLKGYGDHSPIDERAAALSLGLGVLGKNGLVINEKYGSYIFIGDTVTDIPPEELSAKRPRAIEYCHGCSRCLDACPTGILRGEGGDCLSAITQKKGELSSKEAELMVKYNTAWGCDLCQSVCPYNERATKSPISFFLEDRIERLDLNTLSALSKENFSNRAFAWRGRKTVERNLKILENENNN